MTAVAARERQVLEQPRDGRCHVAKP
jgi:hypothetical protein